MYKCAAPHDSKATKTEARRIPRPHHFYRGYGRRAKAMI